LTSASPKVFSAGADLKERSQMTSLQQVQDFVHKLRWTFHRLSVLRIPILTAMEGVALGGGLELALATDIRIASEHSCQMGLPETSLAILPGAGGTQRLAQCIGLARAKEMIFTGQRINSRTAYEYGLIQHVVPDGTTLSFATNMAWTIATNGPIAIQAAKYAIDTGGGGGMMESALDIEGKAYETVLHTQDRVEGLRAFQEKRKPQYKGQ
jgi:enoyl-CoA hydratase/carnithine racemase